MEQTVFNGNNHIDYVANDFFKALNIEGAIVYEPRVVNVGDEKVVVVDIHGKSDFDGKQTTSGAKLNVTLWPRNHATEEDLALLEKLKAKGQFDNMVFRVGYHVEVLADGSVEVKDGQRKWLALSMGGKTFKLSGEKREFQER